LPVVKEVRKLSFPEAFRFWEETYLLRNYVNIRDQLKHPV